VGPAGTPAWLLGLVVKIQNVSSTSPPSLLVKILRHHHHHTSQHQEQNSLVKMAVINKSKLSFSPLTCKMLIDITQLLSKKNTGIKILSA